MRRVQAEGLLDHRLSFVLGHNAHYSPLDSARALFAHALADEPLLGPPGFSRPNGSETTWSFTGPSRGGRRGASVLIMSAAEQLIEAALKLNHEDRAKLVEAVAASLEGEDLGDEWEETLARRVAELESGRVLAVAGEEVFRKLGQRYGDK